MNKNKVEVVAKNGDGKDTKFFVKKPTRKQVQDAQLYSNRAFRKAIESGAMSRERINTYMREQGLWDDEKEKELERLTKSILDGERQLARGGRTKEGKKFTKEDAKNLALEMRRWRRERELLLFQFNELDKYTVQSQAENARFDYLVSVCSYYTNGKRVFDSVDDYDSKAEEGYAVELASALADLMFGLDPNYEKNYSENKFLVKYGFAREDDLRLVNKKGHLVDVEGNLVNEYGRLVDKDGNFIDREGNPVDEDGNPLEEFVEFAD